MRLTSSYGVELVKFNRVVEPTVKLYREAIAYLVEVLNSEWPTLSAIERKLERFNMSERMIHTTKDNVAKYSEFDRRFYKMPAYLRRAAIQAALGAVSSYHSNLKSWEKGGKKGKAPRLQTDRSVMPCFYNKDMYRPGDGDILYLKLYVQNDWKFVAVRGKHTDLEYLRKHWSGHKASAPILEKRYGRYYLRFSYEEQVDLYNKPVAEQTICAVDLGINSDAVCSIMRSDGTILARKFIDFPSDKDHLYHVLNRIKKFQRQHGSHNAGSFWGYAKNLNRQLAIKIATAITDFAGLWNANTIVFEHLDIKGKKRGSRAWKQKLHMWRKASVQQMVEHKAHRRSMHISRICAWGTSRLAFDGSGRLERDEHNHALAVFPNGKQYNCDLSASYNIGARYFIRELLKPLDASSRSLVRAKVPDVERRTSCTYATLLALRQAIA